jgi:hypothetical protein
MVDMRKTIQYALAVMAFVCSGAAATPASAQNFNSGSSGTHGVFPPAPVALNPNGFTFIVWNMETGLVRYCSVYDDNTKPETCTTQLGTAQIQNMPPGGLTTGVYEFTNFDLPDRANSNLRIEVNLVGNSRNNPLTILSQHDIRLGANTYIYANGLDGVPPSGPTGGIGGRGGPGGFAGGSGGFGGTTPTSGNPGFGPSGGAGGTALATTAAALSGSAATASPGSQLLTPVVGGSGGGSGAGVAGSGGFCPGGGIGVGGPGGGGGGGALLLSATDTIVLTNGNSGLRSIYLTGGSGGFALNCLTGGAGGGGSVRLVASTISGSGAIEGASRVRIEASTITYNGTMTGASASFTQFPARPIPTALPALRIASVNGVNAPASPSGNLSTPDISFATAVTGVVAVNIEGANIPAGTTVSVRVVPTASVGPATVATATLSGTLSASTATASIALPPGLGSITVSATFDITPLFTQLNLPTLDGAPPVRVEVVANVAGTSQMYLIGAKGSRVEMTPEIWTGARASGGGL